MSEPQTMYRVKGWDQFFESAKSKTYGHKQQTYMPNKHGLGYKRLLAQPNGEAMFGAWCSMCQVLSRQLKPRRGYLTDNGRSNGTPWSPDDVALVTGFAVETVREMMANCASPEVEWLEPVKTPKDTTRIPQSLSKEPQSLSKEPQSPYPLPSPSPPPSQPPTSLSADADTGKPKRAKRKPKGKPKTAAKPPTDPRVKMFIDWFATAYETTLGRKYIVAGGKDGKLTKETLAKLGDGEGTVDTLKQAAANMMADPWGGPRADISLLVSRLNQWRGTGQPILIFPDNEANPRCRRPDEDCLPMGAKKYAEIFGGAIHE